MVLIKKIKILLLSLTITFFLITPLTFYFSKVSFEKGSVLEIKKGDSLGKVINKLEHEHDFQSSFKLKIMMKILFYEDDIYVGTHKLEDVDSIKDLIFKLRSYPENEVKITILEGWNIAQIGKYLEKKLEVFSSDTFEKYCTDKKFIQNELIDKLNFFNVTSLEGYLYPDTYYVDAYLPEQDLIKIFIKEFLEKTLSFRKKMDQTTMIVASIIEAETDLIAEMDTISSVYNNRISIKMRLESDPTVLYYMTEKDLKKFKNRRTPSERKISAQIWRKYKSKKNPYNTYKFFLPPGPINSPRIEAIEAAINPAETNYLYMVMSSKHGKHIFSENYESHNKKIRGY